MTDTSISSNPLRYIPAAFRPVATGAPVVAVKFLGDHRRVSRLARKRFCFASPEQCRAARCGNTPGGIMAVAADGRRVPHRRPMTARGGWRPMPRARPRRSGRTPSTAGSTASRLGPDGAVALVGRQAGLHAQTRKGEIKSLDLPSSVGGPRVPRRKGVRLAGRAPTGGVDAVVFPTRRPPLRCSPGRARTST